MSTCFAHKNAVRETMKGEWEDVVERDRLDAMEEGCEEGKLSVQTDGTVFHHTTNTFVPALFQHVGTLWDVRLMEISNKGIRQGAGGLRTIGADKISPLLSAAHTSCA